MAPQVDGTRQEAAAIVIQAHYRRYRAQQHYRQQQAAASTIQHHAARFLARRKVARELEVEQRAARFKAVMCRHHERIQQLELEKKSIRELSVNELDDWQAKRHAAAVHIQACWRGHMQRQQLRLDFPAAITLRPVACPSPTFTDRPTPDVRSDQRSQPLLRSVTAAGPADMQAEQSSASVASTAATATAAGKLIDPRLASLDRRSRGLVGSLAAEASSCLSAECSKMSAVSMVVLEDADAPKRSAAVPAARRMVLERQVQLRVDAFKAGSNKLSAMSAAQQDSDQRLILLLQEHQASSAKHLRAARKRQQELQEAEVLHSQLQQLPKLSQLPEKITDAQFTLPPVGSKRAERAQQAHALSLAEAKVGSKWWLPLKTLNQQHKQAAAAGGPLLVAEWKQQEVAWRESWERIRKKEEQRPSPAVLKEREEQQRRVQQVAIVDQELASESSWHAAG